MSTVIAKNLHSSKRINIVKPIKIGIENEFTKVRKQREFLGSLFTQLKLNKLEDWFEVDENLENNNRKYQKLLSSYKNDKEELFKTLYPNYPWPSLSSLPKYLTSPKTSPKYSKTMKNFFKSIENQRKFMQNLYLKLRLTSIDEWLLVPHTKIFKNGGTYLLTICYQNDMKKLLQAIYPNHSFEFDNLNVLAQPWARNRYFKSIENQRSFMENLFYRFNLKSFDDWLKITPNMLMKNGGKSMWKIYSDFEKILISIYPNFPFDFNERKKRTKNFSSSFIEFSSSFSYSLSNTKLVFDFFQSIENQILYLNFLYFHFKFNSLEDWRLISRKKLIQNGGQSLLRIYNNNLFLLLSTIYPNYPFNFSNFKHATDNSSPLYHNPKKVNEYFKSLKNQRNFMDNLFYFLNFNHLDDWLFLSRKEFLKNGGFSVLSYYKNNYQLLLSSIYPFYCFDFNLLKPTFFLLSSTLLSYFSNLNLNILSTKLVNDYFKLIENQRRFFDFLFIKFKLKSVGDWINITRKKILKNGGSSLLSHYNFNLKNILISIYPNYPWNFLPWKFEGKNFFQSIENQRIFIDYLYYKFNFNSLNDWENIDLKKIIKSGIVKLLFFYKLNKNEINKNKNNNKINNLKKNYKRNIMKNFNSKKFRLLSAVYPNYPWEDAQSNLHKIQLRKLIEKFHITQKKDWYRLNEENIYFLLKYRYPNEKWKKNDFTFRSKKTTQRLLFVSIIKIYPTLLIYESYFHPQLHRSSQSLLEYDIFIPSLNIALEYQGEHHYEDIPGGFAAPESFSYRDKLKETHSSDLSITLIDIPFWWDHSLSSLISVLRNTVNSFL